MTESNGYTGKILWVDLSKNTITEEEPGEDIYRKYLGGYGLGVYYIYTRIKPNCDPLGPDNIIGFCPGILTGTPAPFTGRYMVCGKSPLTGKGKKANGETCTGGWGDTNSGGYFGPTLKRAGYDAIFVTGSAEKPVYLYLGGGEKKILDASEVWGKDVVETEKILRKKHGNRVWVTSIGVGGENQVLFSGIVNDKARIAARSGMGAVMGSKKLKAICVEGGGRIRLANKEKVIEVAQKYRKGLKKRQKDRIVRGLMASLTPLRLIGMLRTLKINFSKFSSMYGLGTRIFPVFLSNWGTPWFLDLLIGVGDTPIKNYLGTHKDYKRKIVKKVDYRRLKPYKKKSYGCFSCPVRCGAILSVPELGLEETHRPEYETIAALGSLVLNNDLDVIFKANDYLNREGLDTISTGGVLGFVVECTENGLLKKEDFKCSEYPDGFLPQWGASDYIMPLLKMIVNREGIGDILAGGVKTASTQIEGSEEFALTANGQEPPLHDARFYTNLGVNFTVDPTPGRHTTGCNGFMRLGPSHKFMKGQKLKIKKKPVEMGTVTVDGTKFQKWFDSLGFCLFAEWCGRYPVLEMVEAVVGWKMTLEELTEIGWRIQTLRQMFIAREGAIRHEISNRLAGNPPIKKGPCKKVSLDIEKAAQAYYETIGYDETGIPKEETLNQLGLEFCVKDLQAATGRPEPYVNQYLEEK